MVKLEYVENQRELPWVLFIHGFGGTPNMWNKQVSAFKDKVNICLATLPGHFEGEKLTQKDFKSSNIFLDLARNIIKQLKEKGIKKITTVSVSLGTMVNYQIVKEDPDFVENAVLTGSICGTSPFWQSVMNFLNVISKFCPYKILMRFCAYTLLPKKTHKKARKFLLKESLKMNREAFVFWYKNLTKSHNAICNENLNYKTLAKLKIVMGDEDHVFLNKAKEFANKMGVQIKIIENCGHVCSLHKWREFNEYLGNLLPVV